MVLAELRGIENLLLDRIDFAGALENQSQGWLAASCEDGASHLAQVRHWIEKRERKDLARPVPPWQELEYPELYR